MRCRLAATPALITLAITMGVVVPAAKADLPPDQIVTYRLHVIPTDRDSTTHMEIRLQLAAVEQAGSEIAWQVRSIRIAQLDTEGMTISAWLEEFPVVETVSGLWHIVHADPEAPALDEFSEPPLISGIAPARSSEVDDLQYRLEGAAPPPGQNPFVYDVTSFLDYSFILGGESTPIDEGEDEPVETGGAEDDPNYG